MSTSYNKACRSLVGAVGVSTDTSPGSSPPSSSAAATGAAIAPTAPLNKNTQLVSII